MRSTGIVRRVDELGRIVIPKEIRGRMRIREGDPLEIFFEKDNIVLKKYSPVNELAEFSKVIVDSLWNALNFPVLISDREIIVASAGVSKLTYNDKYISDSTQSIIESRKSYILNSIKSEKQIIKDDPNADKYSSQIIVPIISKGDIVGSIILFSTNKNTNFGDMQELVLRSSAIFIGKQLEA